MSNFEEKKEIVSSKETRDEEKYKILTDLLSEINSVNESDIESVKAAFYPKYQDAFDSSTEERKLIMALLHKQSEGKLMKIKRILGEATDLSPKNELGFHNLRSSIDRLEDLQLIQNMIF